MEQRLICSYAGVTMYSLVNVADLYLRVLRLADSLVCISQRSTAARTA